MDKNDLEHYDAQVKEIHIRFAKKLLEFLKEGFEIELTPSSNLLCMGIHISKNGKHAYQSFNSCNSYDYYYQACFALDKLKMQLFNEFPYLNQESEAAHVGT